MDSRQIAANLLRWLQARMPDAAPRIEHLRLPANGFSSQTFLFDVVTDDGATILPVVLRNKPDHSLYPDDGFFTQSKVLREIGARDRSLPVPEILWEEPDPAITGAPFFVMRRADGRVGPDTADYHGDGWVAELGPAGRRQVARVAVEAMARLHGMDPGPAFDFLRGHAGDGTAASYVDWLDRWYRSMAVRRPVPVIEAALRHLRAVPFVPVPTSIVWGDAKPGNMLFADDLSVAALLDWEAVTLGPGEIDLGWWLMFERRWTTEVGRALPEGFPDRNGIIHLYEEKLGRKVQNLELYEMMAAVGLAIVVTGATERRIAWGELPGTSDMAQNNIVTRMIAQDLGLPPIEISPDYLRTIARTVAATKSESRPIAADAGR